VSSATTPNAGHHIWDEDKTTGTIDGGRHHVDASTAWTARVLGVPYSELPTPGSRVFCRASGDCVLVARLRAPTRPRWKMRMGVRVAGVLTITVDREAEHILGFTVKPLPSGGVALGHRAVGAGVQYASVGEHSALQHVGVPRRHTIYSHNIILEHDGRSVLIVVYDAERRCRASRATLQQALPSGATLGFRIDADEPDVTSGLWILSNKGWPAMARV